jgi:hypothetical protein
VDSVLLILSVCEGLLICERFLICEILLICERLAVYYDTRNPFHMHHVEIIS